MLYFTCVTPTKEPTVPYPSPPLDPAAALPGQAIRAIIQDLKTITAHGWLSDSEVALLIAKDPAAKQYVQMYIDHATGLATRLDTGLASVGGV